MLTHQFQSRPSVLLVDDEPHITHILSRKLRVMGADVRVARTGVEGLQLAAEQLPDIILSDLQMPEMDGIEMAVRLADDPATARVPIIMISGRGFLLDDARLRQTRIIEVLEKPFSVNAVLTLVHKTLSWSSPEESAA